MRPKRQHASASQITKRELGIFKVDGVVLMAWLEGVAIMTIKSLRRAAEALLIVSQSPPSSFACNKTQQQHHVAHATNH